MENLKLKSSKKIAGLLLCLSQNLCSFVAPLPPFPSMRRCINIRVKQLMHFLLHICEKCNLTHWAQKRNKKLALNFKGEMVFTVLVITNFCLICRWKQMTPPLRFLNPKKLKKGIKYYFLEYKNNWPWPLIALNGFLIRRIALWFIFSWSSYSIRRWGSTFIPKQKLLCSQKRLVRTF